MNEQTEERESLRILIKQCARAPLSSNATSKYKQKVQIFNVALQKQLKENIKSHWIVLMCKMADVEKKKLILVTDIEN